MADKIYRHYYSKDDTPLLFYETVEQMAVRTKIVLTVENYSKWYRLWLVDTRGKVTTLAFDVLEPFAAKIGQSAYCDHVPNPSAIAAFCENRDIIFHDVTQEAIIGRWEIEYNNHYGRPGDCPF